jgi:response regulator RpfG family c-di-GMP phosphodiesterase
MISGYQHRVLVVDDEALIGEAIGRLLEIEKLECVYVNSGESALESLKTDSQPFSLIISDQRMPGMPGTQFLEHAKRLNPETIRFLITGHSDMQTIINAVNKGAVQRYISKPWENDEMVQAIQYGIGQYERFLEDKALITLAKQQNAKLYESNCDLMETTTTHTKKLRVIDTEIEAIETQLKELTPHTTLTPSMIMEDLQAIVAPLGEKGQGILNDLFAQTITTLFNDFNDLALGNGFEMPPLGKRRLP